jgi:glycerol-3-phosphate dehydrogenase
MSDRARALERLATERFDLLVIGAGIVGSRIAYDAARSGLRVALVDAGDFGGATSSASSKLVHGGLQYLARGQVGLVWQAQHERRELLTRIAPHLVRPLPILLAIDRRGSFPRPLLRGGLVLYSLLSGLRERPPPLLDTALARTLVPPLRSRDGRVYACLPEAQTHDGRLVLATCCAAARAGAVIANHLRIVGFGHEHGRATGAVADSTLGEGSMLLRARALVNATGPWVDRIRQLEDPHCRPLARLSKGTHLVLAVDSPWQAGVAVSLDRARLTFAVPWQGMLLIGTSDTPYEGDPSAVGPTEAETAELLGHAAQLLRPELLEARRILHAFSGLRALPTGTGETKKARRAHQLAVGRGGIVSVAGGKLTTHRLIAAAALRRLPRELAPRRLAAETRPLPGGSPWRLASSAGIEGPTLEHLVGLYGSDTPRLLSYARDFDDALDPIDPRAPDVWAQVHHAIEREWAVTVEDVLVRRTTLGVRGLDDRDLRTRIAARLGRPTIAA